MAEIEKARAIVNRALEEISMEKIQEKLNIWIAYLNLENMFGTNVRQNSFRGCNHLLFLCTGVF